MHKRLVTPPPLGPTLSKNSKICLGGQKQAKEGAQIFFPRGRGATSFWHLCDPKKILVPPLTHWKNGSPFGPPTNRNPPPGKKENDSSPMNGLYITSQRERMLGDV